MKQQRVQSAQPGLHFTKICQNINEKKHFPLEKKFNYEISDILIHEPTYYQQKVVKNMLRNQMHRSQEKVYLLRQLFIETALKYIGTPYKKKYLEPTDPNYFSPLFLDCCGFIRKVLFPYFNAFGQVVYDLRKEFGFQLAYYNQAYQFDTLPILLKHEEAQPGDLIFYSAIYYDKHKKKQKHNMTHVEIFMGGTKSLGARKKKGTIQIFEDFKFKSLYYYDINIYFKSLNPWLHGICRSFCPQHI